MMNNPQGFIDFVKAYDPKHIDEGVLHLMGPVMA
jgi:hypothetical protein